METITRKTINFDSRDAQVVAPYLDDASSEHEVLERLTGKHLGSDSAELRALIMLGVARVRETLLRGAYNDAVDAGDFDETIGWTKQTSAARLRRRAHA